MMLASLLFLHSHQIADNTENESEGKILNLSDIVKVIDDLEGKRGRSGKLRQSPRYCNFPPFSVQPPIRLCCWFYSSSLTLLTPLPPLQSPLLTLPFLDNIVLYSSCWYESAWEPHLRESEAAATQYQVGTAFFIVGLSYMLTSLPAGAVSIPLAAVGKIFLSQIHAAWFK